MAGFLAKLAKGLGLGTARDAKTSPMTPPPMTPERRALIGQAMAIHGSRKALLAELGPEERKKLNALAVHLFMSERDGSRQ